MQRVAVTAAATAPAGLAGCQSNGDGADDSTPSESGAGTKTPKQEDNVAVEFNLASEGNTFQPLEGELKIGNKDAVNNYVITVETPAGEELEFDDNPEQVLNDPSIFDTAGEYTVTAKFETTGGNREIDQTVKIDWLSPGITGTDIWETVMSDLDSTGEFYEKVTSEGEFTQIGEQAGKLLQSSGLDDEIRVALAKAIITKEGDLNQYDIGVLKTVVNNPNVPGSSNNASLQEELPADFLTQTDGDAAITLTKLEKDLIFGIEDVSQLEHKGEIEKIRDLLITEGYNQNEADYLRTIRKYETEKINGINPRIEQAKNNGLFEQVIESGNVEDNFLYAISDFTDNGLISARDPEPEQFSATEDPYGSGLVLDGFGKNPDDAVVVFVYSISDAADDDLVTPAIELAKREYGHAGIQTVWLKDTQQSESLGEAKRETLREKMRDIKSERDAIITGLPAHYVFFDEYEDTNHEDTPWGLNTSRVTAVHTNPYKLTGDSNFTKQRAIKWSIMAETVDNLVQDRLDVPYRRTFYPKSENGEKSWTTYYRYKSADRKEIVPEEFEMMEDAAFNLNSDSLNQQDVLLNLDETPDNQPSGETIINILEK